MPRYPRKGLPAGFALREFPDHTYQAYRIDDPSQASPRYTRRLKAVEWCWLLLGGETEQNVRKD